MRGEGVEYDLPTVDLQGLDLYGLKVDGVAMSPDRRLIATSVAHGRSLSRMSIMLWDAQTRERIGHVYEYPGGWYQGDEYREAANPGGGFILPPGILFVNDRELTFCGEEPVTLDVSPSSWAEKACALANRNLTVSEWDQFVGGAFPYEATCILP